MIGCRIYRLKNMHILVFHQMGKVIMHLDFNSFSRSFKSILDISNDSY